MPISVVTLCFLLCGSFGTSRLALAEESSKNIVPNNYRCPPKKHLDPEPGVDWESFTFSLNNVQTDTMWLDRVVSTASSSENEFDCHRYSLDPLECLIPLGTIPMHPASTVLNYGQLLFEGMKAFRRDDGSIALFRPDRNAIRMADGAKRLLLTPVPHEIFIAAACAVVRSNSRWVPPTRKGALYLRPLLFGSGEGLGVKPSSESTFCLYCSPVGNYFKDGLKAIALQAVRGISRAAPGGSGSVKAGGNYAPAFLVQKEVRARGFDEALFLDAVSGEAIEEAGASNFFAVFPNNTIITPSLNSETILPGVTRLSIIELAKQEFNCTVLETRLTLDDLKESCECFCCGTGASITPVGSVSVLSKSGEEEGKIQFGDGLTAGNLTERLYKVLLDIQMGTDSILNKKYCNWILVVDVKE